MVKEENKIHLNILKSLTFFGSIQFIQTFFSLLKGKLLSVLIGPIGLGLLTLYTTFLNTVVYIVGFGLFNSAVRNISIANGKGDKVEIFRVLDLVTKIIILTSVTASCFILLFRNHINVLFFDNTIKDDINFVFFILFIFFSVFSNRNNMLIQSMGKYKDLGKSTLWSSGLSLLFLYPVFYFFKEEGIVVYLLLTSFVIFIISKYFKSDLNVSIDVNFKFKNLFTGNSPLIKLGFVMMLSSLIGNIVTNLINIFIVREGSLSDLGLYNAAITISLQSVGLVFVSLSTEFYPRLSSISHDYDKVSALVNNQLEVVLVVLFPMLHLLQIFAPFIVKVIFTSDFKSIIPFIQVSTVAIVIQALAFVIGNIPMAMGDKKTLFLYNSLLPGIISLIFSLIGYKLFGLMGLVYAMFFVSTFHFLALYFVIGRDYKFVIQRKIFMLFFLILILLTISLNIILFIQGVVFYIITSILLCLTLYITYKKSSMIFGINIYNMITLNKN